MLLIVPLTSNSAKNFLNPKRSYKLRKSSIFGSCNLVSARVTSTGESRSIVANFFAKKALSLSLIKFSFSLDFFISSTCS